MRKRLKQAIDSPRVFAKQAGLCGVLLFLALAVRAQTNSNSAQTSLQLDPAYPVIPPTFWESFHWLIIIGMVVLVLLLLPLVWLALKPAPPVVIPPELVALKALVQFANLPEDGKILSRISQILRRYYVDAFEIPAREMTTAEFCAAMAACPEVGPDLAKRVSDFLQKCDARKFQTGPPASADKLLDRALQLVNLGNDRRQFLKSQIASRPVAIATS